MDAQAMNVHLSKVQAVYSQIKKVTDAVSDIDMQLLDANISHNRAFKVHKR